MSENARRALRGVGRRTSQAHGYTGLNGRDIAADVRTFALVNVAWLTRCSPRLPSREQA